MIIRRRVEPVFMSVVPGPWAVGDDGTNWCVVHQGTGVCRRVGRIGAKGVNYFDRAVDEACSRNRKLAASKAPATPICEAHSDMRKAADALIRTGKPQMFVMRGRSK